MAIKKCKKCRVIPKLIKDVSEESNNWYYKCPICGSIGGIYSTKRYKRSLNSMESKKVEEAWNINNTLSMDDVKSDLWFIKDELNNFINKICFDRNYDKNVDDIVDIVDAIKTLMDGAEYTLTEYLEIYKQRKEEISVWEKKKSICIDWRSDDVSS